MKKLPKGSSWWIWIPDCDPWVATFDLWIWHALFGMSGSNNDLNRLSVFQSFFYESMPHVNYKVNDNDNHMSYYLADGILSSSSGFVKTIPKPNGNKQKLFSNVQEARLCCPRRSRIHITHRCLVNSKLIWWSKFGMVMVIKMKWKFNKALHKSNCDLYRWRYSSSFSLKNSLDSSEPGSCPKTCSATLSASICSRSSKALLFSRPSENFFSRFQKSLTLIRHVIQARRLFTMTFLSCRFSSRTFRCLKYTSLIYILQFFQNCIIWQQHEFRTIFDQILTFFIFERFIVFITYPVNDFFTKLTSLCPYGKYFMIFLNIPAIFITDP